MPEITQFELDDMEYSVEKYSSIIDSIVKAMDEKLTPKQVEAILTAADDESEFDLITCVRGMDDD